MPQIIDQTQPEITTCTTCPYYAPRNDGTDKGWCGLFNVFARESHAQTQDCINEIAVQEEVDEAAVAQQELNTHIEIQAQAIAPEIEVDSDLDPDFGQLYRVWLSYHLLGTFYRALDGTWVAQPVKSNVTLRCSTPLEAQAAVVTLYGMPDEVITVMAAIT